MDYIHKKSRSPSVCTSNYFSFRGTLRFSDFYITSACTEECVWVLIRKKKRENENAFAWCNCAWVRAQSERR